MSDPSTDIAKVLVSEEEIRQRVGELAAQVQSDFNGCDLVVVGLLTGTLMFLADLVREVDGRVPERRGGRREERGRGREGE